MIGKYGGKTLKDMKIWFLKIGVEKTYLKKLDLRAGITAPIMAETTTLGNLLDKIPDPKLNLSCGIGYKWKRFTFDSALFFNPGLSYAERKPVPDLSISISYQLSI
ncbi:MAG: hypothetical protein K9M95_02985 [Candidatus Cloacimonetes bacterium]|nr:hypothetical protein [Candidatus Cloacimonadota bacterium]